MAHMPSPYIHTASSPAALTEPTKMLLDSLHSVLGLEKVEGRGYFSANRIFHKRHTHFLLSQNTRAITICTGLSNNGDSGRYFFPVISTLGLRQGFLLFNKVNEKLGRKIKSNKKTCVASQITQPAKYLGHSFPQTFQMDEKEVYLRDSSHPLVGQTHSTGS